MDKREVVKLIRNVAFMGALCSGSFLLGGMSMQKSVNRHRGDLANMMQNALTNIMQKGYSGLSEEEMLKLVRDEMEFIRMSIK